MANDDAPFELRTTDQIFAMMDNGEFLAQLLVDHAALITTMTTHQMNHGGKVKGGMTIKLSYTLDKQLTLTIDAEAKFDKPKQPKASATVWTTADGMLTPQNPRQASLFGVRDVTPQRTNIAL